MAAVPDVFISYKREERARCERIAAKLRALGLDVWFDAKLEAGKNFDREIEAAVAKSKAVLVLWSDSSVNSQWVRNEAGFGMKNDKLVAARLAPCEQPLAFSAVHYEDLFDPDFQDDHPGWLRLLERISTLVARPSIVSYSQALAQAAMPLEAWARANAADPLARQIRAKADLLGGAERASEPAEPPRRSIAPLVIAGVAALVVGLGVGAVGMRMFGPVGEANAEAAAAPVAAAPPPPAATLVGKWGPLDRASGRASCNPHEIEIWLGRDAQEILVVGAIDRTQLQQELIVGHQQVGEMAEGRLRTTGAYGEVAYQFEPAEGDAPARLSVFEPGGRSWLYGACP